MRLFSKSQWFSAKKLRLGTSQIWKKAHLRKLHDKNFWVGGYLTDILENAPSWIWMEMFPTSKCTFFRSSWKMKKSRICKMSLDFKAKMLELLKKRCIFAWICSINSMIWIYFESLWNCLWLTQDWHNNF